MFRVFCVGILAACLLTVAGCGGDKDTAANDRAPAKGQVFLDGEPLLGGGTVKFRSVENERMQVSVNLNSDGQFLVANAPTGKVKMTVVTMPKLYPEMTPIPKKYSKLTTSGLEGTVSHDGEPFEIKLKSK